MDKLALFSQFKKLLFLNTSKESIKKQLKISNVGFSFLSQRLIKEYQAKKQTEKEQRIMIATMLEAEMFELIEKEKKGEASKQEVDELICINLKYTA